METFYTIIIAFFLFIFIPHIIDNSKRRKRIKKYEDIRKSIENYTGEKIKDFSDLDLLLNGENKYTYITENNKIDKIDREKIDDIIQIRKNRSKILNELLK